MSTAQKKMVAMKTTILPSHYFISVFIMGEQSWPLCSSVSTETVTHTLFILTSVCLVAHTQRSTHQPISLDNLLCTQQQLNSFSHQQNVSLVKEIGRKELKIQHSLQGNLMLFTV